MTRFASIVISVNDLLTSMTEMSELRYLYHFSIIKYSISKKMCTVPKKVILLCQIKRAYLYHCSQLERLLSYFSSLCVLLNDGFFDNKVLKIYTCKS